MKRHPIRNFLLHRMLIISSCSQKPAAIQEHQFQSDIPSQYYIRLPVHWIAVTFIFIAVLVPSSAVLAQTTSQATPAVISVDPPPARDSWKTIRPGGETACAAGEFEFHGRQASPDRLLIYFYGGGACWDIETCSIEGGTFSPSVGSPPERRSGIFDLDHPDNPFADYSMLAVPYCTGDLHLGDRESTYTTTSENGEQKSFTIPHRGLVNGHTALQWAYDRFDAPEQIVVTGSSAGAVAVPFYADQLARRYPEARVIGLGDGAGAYRSTETGENSEIPSRWGVPNVLQRYDGWVNYRGSNNTGIEQLYLNAARGVSNLELYQFDQAYDAYQFRFIELTGTEDPDLLVNIKTNQAEIRQVQPSFRSYIVGGYEHTALSTPRFYYYETNGYRFIDWLGEILAGESVTSVECTDCERPGLRFTSADLKLMNRSLELLAYESQWNPSHEGRCPAVDSRARKDLLCTLIHAARESGRPLSAYPANSEIYHAVIERTGPGPLSNQFFWDYNNADSTDYEDIKSLLTEVRNRVEKSISAP